jgi:hypothetical protein
MKVNKISPDIYEVEDFVSVGEQQYIINFCKNLEEDQWWIPLSEEYKKEFFYGKQYNAKKPFVFTKIDRRVNLLFSSMLNPETVALQRYKKDDKIQPHKDYWLYDLPYHVRYGICIYYNDDYEGGELFYPDLGIIHKPKARSLVMHGGNINHETLPVTSDDERYFSTAFITGSKEVPVVLNKSLFREIEEHDGSEYK